MKIAVFLIFIQFLDFHSLATPHNSNSRLKRESPNLTKYKHSVSLNKTEMTDFSVTNGCNASIIVNSVTENIRRSFQDILKNAIKIQSTLNTTKDDSILSDEFMNCEHVYIEPNCYQVLNNESIYISLYDMLLNRSNYIENENGLFICPIFYDRSYEEKLESDTTATDISVTKVCNSSAVSDSDTGRRRRSIDYVLENITTTQTPPDTEIDLSRFSDHFLNCTHISLEPECYQKLDNGSVYVPPYKMVFDRSDYLINNELLFICSDILRNRLENKFSNNFKIVSDFCTGISTACIILHIIIFIVVKQLRNLPGYCLLSLCFALIGAYICMFIQNPDSSDMFMSTGISGCAILGMFRMYFFLAAFFWMNVMAYDVWKSIRLATAKLRLTTNRAFIVQYARYSLFAWGTPLMIAIISIIIHYSAPEHSKYRLIFDQNLCWFKYKSALSLYFAGPLFLLLSLNIIFFVSSFVMISNAAMSKKHSKNNKGSSDLWSRLFLSLRLGSVMGFMWIFGFLAAITKQEWLWYLYLICSALQGVFIFFSFTVSERARKSCMKVLLKRKCSVLPTQTTSQQGSSEQNASSV